MKLIGSKLGAPFVDGGLLCPVEKVYLSVEEKAAIEEAKRKELEAVVQTRLEDAAKAKGYDSILSACSYAGFANPFQAESQEFIAKRGATWTKCYEILAAVKSGVRPMPTIEELIAELPELGI